MEVGNVTAGLHVKSMKLISRIGYKEMLFDFTTPDSLFDRLMPQVEQVLQSIGTMQDTSSSNNDTTIAETNATNSTTDMSTGIPTGYMQNKSGIQSYAYNNGQMNQSQNR